MTAPLVFVDSGVLLATVDGHDLVCQRAARVWLTWCWQQRTGRISTQVLNEFYNGALQRFVTSGGASGGASGDKPGGVTAAHIRTHVRRLREWQPPHLDRYAVDGAWDLQDRYSLSYWTALIVSSAQQQGCSHLLSLEIPAGQSFEGVLVISPLTTQPTDTPFT